MKPEDKVVSLETAKLLKTAGFPQDTERMWEGIMHDVDDMRFKLKRFKANGNPWAYAAPDAQEIGELLPHSVDTKEGSWIITMPNLNGFRYLDYIKYSSNGVGTLLHGYPLLSGKNEAEARAACWLWLKEQGLI